MKRLQILCMTAGLLPAVLIGAVWDWKTYTAMTKFSQLAATDSLVWGATEGGVAAFDPQTQEFTTWTNTEGLSNNAVSAIAADDSGRIWIGFETGMLQRFDPKTESFMLISDYEGYPITCLAPVHDTLFVGLDIGVSLYLVSRQEVKETYRRLGPKLEVEIPVVDIVVSEKTLWIATAQGVAFTSLENVNLLDPTSWTNITTSNGLPSNDVRALSAFQGAVYIGTANGVLRVSGSQQEIVSSAAIKDIAHDGNQLYILRTDGVYQLIETGWIRLGSAFSNGLSLIIHPDSGVFVGLSEGLAFFDSTDGEWETLLPNCPLDNRFSDLAIDQEGILWTATAPASGCGFSRFDGMKWTNYSFPASSALNNVMAVAVDVWNRKWFGSFGGGAIMLEGDTITTIFDASNSLLVGYSGHVAEPVIQDVACESNGTVWFGDFSSYIGKPLVSLSSESVWTNYSSSDFDSQNTGMIDFTRIKKIMIDSAGRKWVGTESSGVVVLDDNGTPTDKSDDKSAGTVTGSEGLKSLAITALAEDIDGTIWIGTKLGLYTYIVGELQVTRNYWPSSDNISAITIDGANNIWVGHDTGISYRRNDDYTWYHFSTDNSPLADDLVYAIVSDPATGILYIGTAGGLSVFETPFSEPRESMEEIRLYPNPFIPAEHGSVTIDELTTDVAVHIYSIAGFLVREYPQDQVLGRRILWDGRNTEGQIVPSGIYLVVEKSETGEKRIGKLAVIR